MRNLLMSMGLILSLVLAACGGPNTTPSNSSSGQNSNSGQSTTNAVGANSVPMVVDAGVSCNGCSRSINVPYVSVTICAPAGSTGSTCQTIDHVLVDTGSVGLRLISSTINAGLLSSLPVGQDTNKATLGECASFADGFTWGGVRLADVKLGGEVAPNIAINTIGEQPAGYTGIPDNCSGTGHNESTVATFGANGVLGVGLALSDCDNCTNGAYTPYYACTATGCSGTVPNQSSVVVHPVSKFAKDNNGVVLALPSVPNNGVSLLQGSLIFGVGTQSNNALTTQAIFPVDEVGHFTTQYAGNTMPSSFLDSGSNALYFADSTIAKCTHNTGFYCPSTVLNLSASNTSAYGNTTGVVNFNVVNIDQLSSTVTAAPIAASGAGFNSVTGFDWGLPFFFGRNVYTVIEGSQVSGQKVTGPFWAY